MKRFKVKCGSEIEMENSERVEVERRRLAAIFESNTDAQSFTSTVDIVDFIDDLLQFRDEENFVRAAIVLSSVYAAYMRVVAAYVSAHAYLSEDAKAGLGVVDFTINHWSSVIAGSPKIDDQAVLKEAEADKLWHQRNES